MSTKKTDEELIKLYEARLEAVKKRQEVRRARTATQKLAVLDEIFDSYGLTFPKSFLDMSVPELKTALTGVLKARARWEASSAEYDFVKHWVEPALGGELETLARTMASKAQSQKTPEPR